MTSTVVDIADYAAGHQLSVPFESDLAHGGVHADPKHASQNHGISAKEKTVKGASSDITYSGSEEKDADQYEVSHPDYPTQTELDTLRKVAGKVPWTAYTIAFVELCERFSYYGATAVYASIR